MYIMVNYSFGRAAAVILKGHKFENKVCLRRTSAFQTQLCLADKSRSAFFSSSGLRKNITNQRKVWS